MNDKKNYNSLCQFAKECPVFQGDLIIERISPFLLKNVFCNRGFKGWRNCERYKLAEMGVEIPAQATPYEL